MMEKIDDDNNNDGSVVIGAVQKLMNELENFKQKLSK